MLRCKYEQPDTPSAAHAPSVQRSNEALFIPNLFRRHSFKNALHQAYEAGETGGVFGGLMSLSERPSRFLDVPSLPIRGAADSFPLLDEIRWIGVLANACNAGWSSVASSGVPIV
ncbi:MAG: hypothetical protein ACK5PZ_01830, partial [Pirellula sp.]